MRIRFTRDFIVLPLLALTTFVACIAAAEGFALLIMPEELRDSCEVEGGHRHNCASRMKVAEGPDVEMRYNDCGSRSDSRCAAPPAGNFRVVTLGTSVSNGYGVTQNEMYSTVAARELASFCKRPVDFQHAAITWRGSSDAEISAKALGSADAALAMKPDVLLVVITSWDLYKYVPAPETTDPVDASVSPSPGGFRNTPFFKLGQAAMKYFREQREGSRFVLMSRHLLYRNEEHFLASYLGNVDESGYLRAPLQPSWEKRATMFEMTLSAIHDRAAAAGVPLAFVYSPSEPLTLFTRNSKRTDIDTTVLNGRFAEIARRNGWTFIDPLPRFAAAPRRQELFFRVNGHPNGLGHKLLGQSIAAGVEATPTLGCFR